MTRVMTISRLSSKIGLEYPEKILMLSLGVPQKVNTKCINEISKECVRLDAIGRTRYKYAVLNVNQNRNRKNSIE